MAEVRIAVDPKYAAEIQNDPEKMRILIGCATDFRVFLNYWHFKNQNNGKIEVLGHEVWSGQELFIERVQTHDKIYALKARKLGYTTIEQAYDGWVARFKEGSRVHLFSRRQDAAQEILEAVVLGLDRLPDWMRLPKTKDVKEEKRYKGGPDDERIIKAYPADEDTSVEANCNHAHVDEWARMGNPERVWQAIEPSMAGSCHLITTGMGPANYTADFWMKTMAGDTEFIDHFVPALNRPDRNEAWLEKKRLGMSEKQFRQEYAMTWKDALYGGGVFIFDDRHLAQASIDAWGPTPPKAGHKYLKAWDIGRHHDSTVVVVLDITYAVVDVVFYDHWEGEPYPMTQRRIEKIHELYRGKTFIEENAAGLAVIENLDIHEDQLEGFKTTGISKPRIIEGLVLGFAGQTVKYSAKAWPRLHNELQGYQIPDDEITQDSVMALAIGVDCVGKAISTGRVHKVQVW
jgi:hypothetical protein